MTAGIRNRGKVLDPQNDARVGRGAETCRTLRRACLDLALAGNYRPALKEIEAASGVPASTIKNYYPRLALLSAVVADQATREVVASLGLGMFSSLKPRQQHALAYALLVGERFTGEQPTRRKPI